MERALLIAHAVGILAVLVICAVAGWDSISYFGTEPLAFTLGRASVGLLCGLFAAAHLYLLVTKRLTLIAALLFYPLCLALGLVTELVVRSSAKGWAPASSEGAAFASLLGYGVIALLVIACAASCYWSVVRSRRSNA
jgi:hypothetical protein